MNKNNKLKGRHFVSIFIFLFSMGLMYIIISLILSEFSKEDINMELKEELFCDINGMKKIDYIFKYCNFLGCGERDESKCSDGINEIKIDYDYIEKNLEVKNEI